MLNNIETQRRMFVQKESSTIFFSLRLEKFHVVRRNVAERVVEKRHVAAWKGSGREAGWTREPGKCDYAGEISVATGNTKFLSRWSRPRRRVTVSARKFASWWCHTWSIRVTAIHRSAPASLTSRSHNPPSQTLHGMSRNPQSWYAL